MPTIAEILNAKSKDKANSISAIAQEKANYIAKAQQIQKEKDILHIYGLVKKLKKEFPTGMDFQFAEDEKNPRVKYKDNWYRLRVMKNTPYIVSMIGSVQMTFVEFMKKTR